MNRRSFLKMLGGAAALAAVAPIVGVMPAAPLFIPSQRLDFGVPTQQLMTARQLPMASTVTVERRLFGADVPMLMLHDNFSFEYAINGDPRIPVGATIMVDESTAERWIASGVATPGPHAPLHIQEHAARALAGRRAKEDAEVVLPWYWDTGSARAKNADRRAKARREMASVDPIQAMIDRKMAQIARQRAEAAAWS